MSQKRIKRFSKASQKDQISCMLNLQYPFRLGNIISSILPGLQDFNAQMTSCFNGGHVASLLFKMKAVISHFLLLGNDELNIKVQCLAKMCEMMS